MGTSFKSYKLTEYNSILEIPIYRISPEQFEKELEKGVDRISLSLSKFEELYDNNKQVALEKYNAHRRDMKLHIEYPWKFNEIIGWVSLNIDNEIFSGEIFLVESKKIFKGYKAKVKKNEDEFRFDVLPEMSNLDIYLHILQGLHSLTSTSSTKGRFIDTHRFKTVGRFINWKELFDSLNS